MPFTIRLPFDSDGLPVLVTQSPGTGESHSGALYNSWDFALVRGAGVLAVADGTVVDIRESVQDGGPVALPDSDGDSDPSNDDPSLGSGAIGNVVTLRHVVGGQEFYSTYMHLERDSVPVSVGDQVSAGQMVGRVGNTGARDGTHLHFQVGSGLILFGGTIYGAVTGDSANPQQIADANEAQVGLVEFSGYGMTLPLTVIGPPATSEPGQTFIGTAASEMLVGGDGADTIDGQGGNDTIDGGAGADTAVFFANRANFSITTLSGITEVTGLSSAGGYYAFNTVRLTNVENLQFADATAAIAPTSNTLLIGTTGNNSLLGSSANETIDGRGGNDTIDGGAGADTAVFFANRANFSITTLSGITEVTGLSSAGGYYAFNTVRLTNVENLQFADATAAIAPTSNTLLIGTTGNNSLLGSSANETIDGRGGNDTIDGGAGADTAVFFANRANFSITTLSGITEVTGLSSAGGYYAFNTVRLTNVENLQFADATAAIAPTSNTLLIGTTGNNSLLGSSANETIDGRGGNDTIDGGAGADTAVFFANRANFSITTLSGITEVTGLSSAGGYYAFNTVRLTNVENLQFADATAAIAPTSNTLLIGTTGNNSLLGSSANETIDGRGGNDTIDGGAGADTAVFFANRANFSITTLSGITEVTGLSSAGGYYAFNTVRLTNVENLQFADATAAIAPTSNTLLIGTTGNNSLLGSSANETIDGRGGNDTIDGGAGADTAVFFANRANFSITTLSGITEVTGLSSAGGYYAFNTVRLTNVENLQFADATAAIAPTSNTLLIGTTGNNSLLGSSANETIDGRGGNDTIDGGTGADTAVFFANRANFSITTLSGITEVTGLSSAGGHYAFNTVRLTNVENLQFADATLTVPDGGVVAPTQTAKEIFAGIGYFTALADLAKAAYHLSPWEQLHDGQSVGNNPAIPVHGNGENYIKPYADDAWDRVAENWQILGNADLGLSSSGTTSGPGTDEWFLEADGVYHCENAAAFAVRCKDAVIISIRGTNDNDNDIVSDDMADWLTMQSHYEELLTFLNAVDRYVEDRPGEITSIYVTGHSLGGAMVQKYMDAHRSSTGATLEAVTFAAPAFVGGLAWDPRVISVELDGDPVPDVGRPTGYVVTARVGGLLNQNGSEFSGSDFHSMDLYREVASTFDEAFGRQVTSNPAPPGSTSLHGFARSLFGGSFVDLEVELGGGTTFVGAERYTWGDRALAPQFSVASGNDNLVDTSILDPAEYFIGGPGQDTLGGAVTAAPSILIGGTGSDSYVVDRLDDRIVESGTALGEIDGVLSSVTWTLSANLELLTLTGAAANGTGNGLANLITGNALANTLAGGGGNDTLNGAAGNDLLNGGSGTDRLVGGTGNDTYVVDIATDVVNESSTLASEIDAVQSSVSWVLGANLERLTLTGTATNGTGNTLANLITGNASTNTLVGGSGNDTLNGAAGNDTINGGTGTDNLVGGTGSDTYVVDIATDVVNESSTLASEIDAVQSSVSWVLGANLERLTLTGTATNGTGNTLANLITGNASTNTLVGGSGNDTLNGAAGNDTINGGTGTDNLVGGTGSDTYVVDIATDVVNESSTLASEIDAVQSSVSWVLGANLERLTLTGTATNGTGNTLANLITGNASTNTLVGGSGNDTLNGGAGNDTIDGGAGNDSLVGGTGVDVFRFTATLSATGNVDRLSDFVASDDAIQLENSIFIAIGAAGALSAGAFRAGSRAGDANDRVIYDGTTGQLFYDADGSGAGLQILFATTTPGSLLAAADFVVI
ncbi:MAG: peptidoglycan DD-metalloendopeptidase family protein [Piscinibacter sp.]|uniref:peptidoglycan DD-metalloendopeptidase family protein n=1 Tax=Piscinibacter sp. TaxID=1903157 RepID=UPI00258C467C|nr:peptidoglycan DD-metalloendopeptidase family protein [Piscinibacter sp.]MCW5662829.1 peptidoglycan DD-metalloendopeptidase family protein [Piscinibacter sp.]